MPVAMRVLMLGWEYPPHISGGLGTACQGIVGGLVGAGAEVLMVVPRLSGDEDGRGAWLLSAGDVALPPHGAQDPTTPSAASDLERRLQLAFVESPLRPYQTRGSYQELLRRLRHGERRSGQGPHPGAEARPFEGGYGEHLSLEVERYARAVAELARREDFDVIHAHDWMTFPAGLLARRVSGRPLVCHVHSCELDRSGPDADPGIHAIEQLGLDAADAVVVVSHYERSVLASGYRLDPERTFVVHNALTRRAAREHVHVPEHGPAGDPAFDRGAPPTVLFLARLTRQKGPGFFLSAAAAIAARRPDVRFVVGGDGDLRHALIERAAELGLGRRVFFTGFLTPEEVERAYAEADVYVMPSVSEPFGIAPLEALALDTPVILSRQSGVTEALPSSLTIDYGDVEDLAAKVLMLLERPELRAALVRSGQAELEELRWEASAHKLLEVYGLVTGALTPDQVRAGPLNGPGGGSRPPAGAST
jgi:glycosyltransferase involved in cell wall biosynthesis